MRKLIYGLLMATTLTSPTFAVTAAPVWADEPLRLDDSVLGTWCYTRTDRVEGKSLHGSMNATRNALSRRIGSS